MATKRNLIRLTAAAEETAARAESAKARVQAAKFAVKEARKMLKSAKKAAKQARRKLETAGADGIRGKEVRKGGGKKTQKAPARKSRGKSRVARKTVAKPRLVPAAVAASVIDRMAAASRADKALAEDEASQGALASTLV